MNGAHFVGPKRRISVVLPVTLHETGVSRVAAQSWRASVDDGALLRTELLLNSFVTQFDQDDLANFFIVSPARDLARLSVIIRSITSDPRYELVPEADVCQNIHKVINSKTDFISGWRVQQMIKLAISEYVSTSHYLTLDSDILCMRRFSFNHLVTDDRAITNCETPADYLRIYTDSFAAKEIAIKMRRYARSGQLLGCPCLHVHNHRFYGETPAVLRTDMACNLRAHLTERFQRAWSEVLALERGWTEYGLYYHFLDMTGKIDACCLSGGCNTVLDLERSVWQASENYRGPRLYDADHFARSQGLFVAIQSWLPGSSWLPKRCKSIADFYKEVNGWREAGHIF
jgi:hypothetical protein